MKIGNILQYGVYNSKKQNKGVTLTPLRHIQSFEFDYILSCDPSALSHIDDKSCPLAPNLLIIRKPNQKSQSRLHFKCYCLHLEIDESNPLFSELFATPDYFTFINPNTYRPLFEALFQHLTKSGKDTNDHFVNAKILELIYHIKKDEKYNQKIGRVFFQKENRSIQKAISFMKKNYENNILLKDLGELTGYSPNHFQRLFTETMGISPSKYLENLRVNKAKYLLMENEKTLSEIAYQCGFSSQAYFSKVFKKHTLLSPFEFQTNALFKYLDNPN